MSSVKRTQVASSEQPKAPDKCETASSKTNHHTSAAASTEHASSENALDASMSSSTSKSQQHQQQQQQQSSSSRDAQKSGNSTQPDTKNLHNWDEEDLKSLLEEAIEYRRPKDKENKSEAFKALLHNAELETQAQDTCQFYLSALRHRSNNRRHPHTHGGSLQDLVESVGSEQFLDNDYFSSGQTRRQHQQNSRYQKHSSSVSSRQREGGSLPCNVNVTASSNYPTSLAYTDSFPVTKNSRTSNSSKSKSESHDKDQNCTTVNSAGFSSSNIHRYHYHYHPHLGGHHSNYDGINEPNTSASTSNDTNHTIINIDEPDETRHLLAHDSLAQGLSESTGDEGTELISIKKQRSINMNYIPSNNVNMDIAVGDMPRQNHSVDTPVTFFDSQLGSKAIGKNPTEAKYLTNSAKYLTPNLGIVHQASQKQFDENGNAILPKTSGSFSLPANQAKVKKRSNKSERNTKTWTVPQPEEGSDTKYDIAAMVAFIENKDVSKKPNIINVNKNIINSSDRSRKEKKNASKKGESKLKKSTSMEELKSRSKIEEEIAQSERDKVSMRQKQMQQQQQQQQQQNSQKRNNGNGNGADSKEVPSAKQQSQTQAPQQQQPANKRSERRSWGTEELNYLGEREAAAAAAAVALDERETKKQKEKPKNVKKVEQQPVSTTESFESIPANVEAAEFHVVTKKKSKKRQILEEAKAKQQTRDQNNLVHNAARNIGSNSNNGTTNKYQPSNSYTNDRDVYLNSLTTKENRRKSTSSVPPSDKSDSSDLDSIHSLPIESTQSSCTPVISYADIARTANQPPADKLNANAWPTVSYSISSNSAEKPLAALDNSNLSTCSSTVSSKSQVSGRGHDVIKGSPLDSTSVKQAASNTPRAQTGDDWQPIVNHTEEKRPSAAAVVANDAKYAETIKQPSPLNETAKNQLQKSKSVDSEKYTATMSLDQFPGLEKTVKPQKSHPNFAAIVTSPTATQPSDKNKITKKSSPPAPELNAASLKEAVPAKAQKPVIPIEKANTKPDVNQTKLVFVQNNAKAEEIANSDSSNLFVPISAAANSQKKTNKKNQSNASQTTPNATMQLKNTSYHRPAAVIFSDHETNNENVSPLLFGDFNDDILQLMKQDDSFVQYKEDLTTNHRVAASTPSYNKTGINSSCNINNNNTFESADHNTVTDSGNESKISDITPMTLIKSDPGHSSIHHSTQMTESPEMADIHRKHMQSQATVVASTVVVMPTELTKQNNFTSNNHNNKTSDVVSNQSINNNNISCNDNKLGDVTLKVHSNNSDLDSYNNNENSTSNSVTDSVEQDNPHRLNNAFDSSDDVHQQSSQSPINQHQNHNSVNSKTNAANNNPSVYKVNAKNSNNNNNSANNYLHPNQGIINYDNVNSKNVDNSNQFRQNNSSYGSKTKREINNKFTPNATSTANRSQTFESVENDTITINSHSSSIGNSATSSRPSQKQYNESRPSMPISHSHEKIVNFVGLAWEDILHETSCGGAHYYNGQ